MPPPTPPPLPVPPRPGLPPGRSWCSLWREVNLVAVLNEAPQEVGREGRSEEVNLSLRTLGAVRGTVKEQEITPRFLVQQSTT